MSSEAYDAGYVSPVPGGMHNRYRLYAVCTLYVGTCYREACTTAHGYFDRAACACEESCNVTFVTALLGAGVRTRGNCTQQPPTFITHSPYIR
jgi:hypothetical protein